jgi:hypothetical protein
MNVEFTLSEHDEGVMLKGEENLPKIESKAADLVSWMTVRMTVFQGGRGC